ncbi:hypothetical protein FZEAL_1886 [Fusarium zealandicum]|uniref:Uncharacterized protein n=1 Tax=Fusarium zealandicum TaxID=1053134 RepID=A0A8H4XPG3_9HYPO|nr:hypothetical protein FZEAL_1886 [Fusarium zealandicum]
MPPVIILDSDDDEEEHGYSPPRSPHLLAHVEPPATHSSGRVSRATTSTDPSFFQNIYDEQNDAAHGYAPQDIAGSHDMERLSSSEMTAPVPFKRTVTGLIEPSSLMSVADPTVAKSQNIPHSNGPDEWTQASTPGRRKAPTAIMDDPWDVPSSPEVGQDRLVSKIRIKRQQPQPHPMPILNVPNPGYEGDSQERRKRRKVDYSEPSQQGSNEVDLVAIPFSNDNEEVRRESQRGPTPSMLPPTLPVNEDVSFYIATKTLTEAQKMEYESVQLPSSGSHPLPPVYQFDLQNLGSSGSATNINTQRSDGTCLMSTAPQPQNVMDPARLTTRRATMQRWDSSPDVIAAAESPPRENDTRLPGRPRGDTPAEPIADEVLEINEPDTTELPAVEEASAPDPEPEYVEPPVKAKKPRGRPKKKGGTEVSQSTDLSLSHAGDGEQVTKPKKKRGRPRKSEKPTPQLEEQLEAPLPNEAVLIADEDTQPETKSRARAKVEEIRADDEHVEEVESPKRAPALARQESSKDELAVLEEISPNSTTKPDPDLDDRASSEFSEEIKTAGEGKEEKQEVAQKNQLKSYSPKDIAWIAAANIFLAYGVPVLTWLSYQTAKLCVKYYYPYLPWADQLNSLGLATSQLNITTLKIHRCTNLFKMSGNGKDEKKGAAEWDDAAAKRIATAGKDSELAEKAKLGADKAKKEKAAEAEAKTNAQGKK